MWGKKVSCSDESKMKLFLAFVKSASLVETEHWLLPREHWRMVVVVLGSVDAFQVNPIIKKKTSSCLQEIE